MKSIFTFLAVVLISLEISAQSQRMVLFEEFTSASCYWCGVYNPGFQTLLNNNSTKCTAIKYQSNFGYDPMYDHNPAESSARGSFYSVPGYPDCVMDGNQFHGSPGSVNQTMINNRYAVPSPLEISINQRISDDQDSIYVTALIKATQAFSGNLVAHLVVIEKHIHFNTAPGTNGEKDFYNVMKKMLPGSTGTVLPLTWEQGDYVLIQEAWELANVYKVSELSVVGFVQNNTTKEVLQAANTSSAPISALFHDDSQIRNISGLLDRYCINHINPVVNLRNNGSSVLTNVKFHYKVNDGNDMEYEWSGNLPFLAQTQVSLPEIEFPLKENNTLMIFTDNPNNSTDGYRKNDTLYYDFEDAVQALTTVKVLVRTDAHPEETTWELKDQTGAVFASGGPYSQANKIYTTVLTPGFNTCYDFFLYDLGGDGVLNGFYSVYSPFGTNQQLILGGGTIDGSEEHFQFFGPSGVGNEQILENKQITIIPNPAHYAAKAIFSCNTVTDVKGVVSDASGRTVIEIPEYRSQPGINELVIETDKLQPGIYLVSLLTGTGEKYNSKLIVR